MVTGSSVNEMSGILQLPPDDDWSGAYPVLDDWHSTRSTLTHILSEEAIQTFGYLRTGCASTPGLNDRDDWTVTVQALLAAGYSEVRLTQQLFHLPLLDVSGTHHIG